MTMNIVSSRFKGLYNKILNNKFLTICVLFTFFTLLDSSAIVLDKWPPKAGKDPYIHLLARLILHSILVSSIYIYEVLRKKFKSKLMIYVLTYIITWGILLGYIWGNSFFIKLHPNAYIDISRSYGVMYAFLGIVYFIGNKATGKIKDTGKSE